MPNAPLTPGTNTTNAISATEISATMFMRLLLNGPILKRERSERMLYAWTICDSDSVMNASVLPPSMPCPMTLSPM